MPTKTTTAAAPRRGALTWRVVTERDELRALAPAWDEICGPTAETLAPAWVSAWFETLGREATPCVLVAYDESERVSGVLPLARSPAGSVELAGAEWGGAHGDVALRPGFEPQLGSGLGALLATRSLRRLRLRRLAADGALLHLLSRGGLPGVGTPRLSAAAPAIVGFRSFDAFLARLSKHRRHEVRRHLRRFDEVPGAHVRWVTDREDVEPALRTLFRLHAERFASRGRSTSFRGAALLEFHRHLAVALHREHRLMLGLLRIDDRSVAVAYGWHRRGRTTLFQMGFDPAAYALGPGIVLTALVLREQVIGAGRSALDLGEGCYPWKLDWANEVRHLVDVDVHGRGAWGRLRRVWADVVTAFRSSAGAHLRGRQCHGQVTPSAPTRAHCHRAGCSGPPPSRS